MAFELELKSQHGYDISYHNFPQLNLDKEAGTVCVIRHSFANKAAREAGLEPVEKRQECVLPFPEAQAVELEEMSLDQIWSLFVYPTLKTQDKWALAVDDV